MISLLHLCSILLGHCVQRASILEPLNLRGIESVCQLDLERIAVLWVYSHGQWLANGEFSGQEVNLRKPS